MLPDAPSSRERSPVSSLKRPLSSSSSSAAATPSAPKRANSEDLMSSDHEGSIGASRLNIASTPDRLDPDATLTGPPSATSNQSADLPPAYDDTPPSPPEDGGDDADARAEDDEQLPIWQSSSSYNGIDPQNQLAMISDVKSMPLEAGDSWFLISRAWLRRWQTACSGVAVSKDDDDHLTPEMVGPIDNSSITAADGVSLRRPLTIGVDVEVLPVPAWRYLCDWYGCKGPEFEREVIATGGFGSEMIEFYPPTFTFFLLLPSSSDASSVSVPTLEHAPTIALSSSTPFNSLLASALEAFSFDAARPCRLWRLPPAGDELSASAGPAYLFPDKLAESGVELLSPAEVGPSMTLTDALLADEHTRLALELQDDAGHWTVDAEGVLARVRAAEGEDAAAPEADEGNAQASAPVATDAVAAHAEKKKGLFAGGGWSGTLHRSKSHASIAPAAPAAPPVQNGKHHHGGGFMGVLHGALTRSKTGAVKGQRGLVGLQNLGNTCFMNSAIQCMSNTKELQEYFLSGVYRSELNPDNPLGMRGQVAEAFGQLIERLWHGSGSSVAPREFKQALARFAPQFSGYGQQDSQELLAFLLDGTHEDLNRIKVKPATEAPDWEGGGDKELVELAKTCWEQYRSRNDSVIVDLFQGQYRSTVVCPDCDKVSIKFDPFMYVTTNLPVTKKWSGKVFVVPLDAARGILSVELEVPKSGTLKTLKYLVGALVDLDPKRLVLVEEWHAKFYKEWRDEEAVTEINTDSDKLILYEVAVPYSQPRPRRNRVAAPPPTADAPVLLPLTHYRHSPSSASSSSSSQQRPSYGIRSHSGEPFGSPFIVSLSADEATSVASIRRAVARQYARVTRRAEDLLAAVEEDIAELERGTAPGGDDAGAMDVEPAVGAAVEAVPVPTAADGDAGLAIAPASAPAEADELAESPSSLLVPEAASSLTPATTDAASEAFVSAPSTAPPTSPTPTPSPSPSPRRQRGPVFRLEVSVRTAGDGRMPLDQHGSSEMQSVEDRARYLAGKARQAAERARDDDVDMFSPTTSRGVEDEAAPPAPAPAPAQEDKAGVAEEAELEGARPLVATGQALVAHWDAEAFEYFFGTEAGAWADITTEVVDPALAARRAQGKGGAKKVITLADCLSEFTKEERLGEDDMWYCGTCKEHKQATKKVELWKVPDVLVFALKRFSSSRYSRDKLDDLVDFPIDGLDLTPWVEGDKVEKRLAEEMGAGAPVVTEPDSLTYDLYAVSNHFGGLGGGHYTAFAKNHENGRWYDFDDSRVSEISPDRIKSSAAYLLFYRRRTARPIGGAKSRELVESAVASRQVSASASDAGTEDLLVPSSSSAQLGGGGGGGGEQHVPGAFPSPPGSAEPGSPKDMGAFDDDSDAWLDRPVPFADPAAASPPLSPQAEEIRLEHAELPQGDGLDSIE
ncbi:hypothetical protein JCM3770_001539 [Rhodotorula araucariae]